MNRNLDPALAQFLTYLVAVLALSLVLCTCLLVYVNWA